MNFYSLCCLHNQNHNLHLYIQSLYLHLYIPPCVSIYCDVKDHPDMLLDSYICNTHIFCHYVSLLYGPEHGFDSWPSSHNVLKKRLVIFLMIFTVLCRLHNQNHNLHLYIQSLYLHLYIPACVSIYCDVKDHPDTLLDSYICYTHIFCHYPSLLYGPEHGFDSWPSRTVNYIIFMIYLFVIDHLTFLITFKVTFITTKASGSVVHLFGWYRKPHSNVLQLD